jgi:hypothetical protein
MLLTLVVVGILASGILVALAVIEINSTEQRKEQRKAAGIRLQSVVEAGRLARDAEAHQANVSMNWEG